MGQARLHTKLAELGAGTSIVVTPIVLYGNSIDDDPLGYLHSPSGTLYDWRGHPIEKRRALLKATIRELLGVW